MSRSIVVLALLGLGIVPAAAPADPGGQFPGSPIDSRTLRIQEKVEELFEAGEYDRARFIYENELAPIGDKYAQYMLGYMYLTGTGVEENALLASAWYRLAAERGNEKFSAVRDQLLESFSEVDRVRSDELYRRLLRDYSDTVIMLELIRDDMRVLSQRTGSRVPGGTSPVTIYNPRAERNVSGTDYYGHVEKRLDTRIEWMRKTLDAHGIRLDERRPGLDDLAQAVDTYLEVTPGR